MRRNRTFNYQPIAATNHSIPTDPPGSERNPNRLDGGNPRVNRKRKKEAEKKEGRQMGKPNRQKYMGRVPKWASEGSWTGNRARESLVR